MQESKFCDCIALTIGWVKTHLPLLLKKCWLANFLPAGLFLIPNQIPSVCTVLTLCWFNSCLFSLSVMSLALHHKLAIVHSGNTSEMWLWCRVIQLYIYLGSANCGTAAWPFLVWDILLCSMYFALMSLDNSSNNTMTNSVVCHWNREIIYY